MIARFSLHLAVTLAVLLLTPALRLLAQAPNAAMDNEFIRLVVNSGPNEAGRFSIMTTGGDPTIAASKNQQLIYGGNAPWTSFTTVRIGEENYVFGGRTERRAGLGAKYGTLVDGPTVKDGAITTTYQYGDILVTQELLFVRGSSSRMLDTLGIVYRINNQGRVAQQVGLRLLLDTKLGANDGAPIRAGVKAIKSATLIPGQELPDYWQAFDSMDPEKMSVVSQGTYTGAGITKPEKVIFADWGTLADDIWEPALDPAQGFIRKDEDEDDTATAIFWGPASVEPGKTVSYVTHYGMGYLKIRPGKLRVAVTAPAETTFEYERTQPFTVTGYLQNTSDFEARNVKFSIKLPEGLRLVGGSKATETVASFKPEEEIQASWTVAATGKASGNLDIKLEVTSENIEANQTSWEIQANVPKPRLVLSPATQSVAPKTNKRATIVPISINLTPAVDFYGVSYTLTYNPTVMRPLIIERGGALVQDGRLLDGWEFDESEAGKITITAMRGDAAKLTQAEINIATITFRVVKEGACPLVLENAVLINDKGAESSVATSAGQVEVKTEPAQ